MGDDDVDSPTLSTLDVVHTDGELDVDVDGDLSPTPIPKPDPRAIAREYQLELSRKAMEENVIVVMETGCGKTLIAILLMCRMDHVFKKPQPKLCVFLAPTVVLVQQQARVIEEFTNFKVGIYGGDAKRSRNKEFEQYEVLVMTPQVLLQCLCHCFIRIETIALLIFDECHYAQLDSNHPYAQIMKMFYKPELAKVPRIFGMTASPICGKGASINSLEALLHAKVYTVNKNELETVVVSPVVQVYYYSSNSGLLSSFCQKYSDNLEAIKRQCISMLCRTGDDSNRIHSIKKLLQKLHNDIMFSLTNLGLWGAMQACQILLNDYGCERNELIKLKANNSDVIIQNEYLSQIASLLEKECMGDTVDGITSDSACTEVLKEPFFSKKVLRLIEILSNFRSRPDMKCIIFVNRIIVARSLSYILGRIKTLSVWKCNFLVGLKFMSRKTMNHILEEFRCGKLNLLVATKVVEEGLDIQTCCLVIRFDLPETLASFIQSRGRARMPQSKYAFLVDSENENELNLMDSFREKEDFMNADIRTRKSNEIVANIKEEIYSVEATGATISVQTSVGLLHHYCSKLPRDEYFNPKPEFFYVDDAEGTICHIILPSNAAIHHSVGTPQSSNEAAKKDASLNACKELHQKGALTKYLLPEQDELMDEDVLDLSDSDGSEDEDSPFRLEEMLVPAALKEPLSDGDNHVCLSSYFIRFMPNPHDRQYKDFGLFVGAPLPCEAKGMEIDLHLAHGRSVFTNLVPSGLVEFNEKEMLLARHFQEMFFKVILERSEFMSNHVPLKNSEVTKLNSSGFYILLPVICEEHRSTILVDWMIIKRCLSSPIFAHPFAEKDFQTSLGEHLQLADGPTPVNVILNSLIYVSHKRSFFFVSQILQDKSAYSAHNGFRSHVEHLGEKFGIHLSQPKQPLLQAKQLFSLRNLLHDRKRGNSESHDLEEHFFELPPELCQLKIIGFSKDIGSSLSLLPSIMHRLENLLVAIELKDMLSKSFVEGPVVSAKRVLEALTTERCQERFSLERLEVLGDAFLKFIVGRHLFLRYETFDEGQLTRKRSNAVNNSNLCKLAVKNKLQVYIRDQEFDPSQFFALGHPCPILCTEQTEKSIHSCSEANLRNGTDINQVRCSKNHHWLSKKTIADVVEALVGAYIVDSGFTAAISFLRWIGIQVEFDVSGVYRAWTSSESFISVVDPIDIPVIERFLGHVFDHKGLLAQAFIHPSYNRHGGGCYQRLEFLGDAVLDYLITSYLYSVFSDLKPGQLTDLRSSLVNNNTFAGVAVRISLDKYIICENSCLRDDINEYVNFINKPASERGSLEEPRCPKALGDMVESCIGAILLDTGFDLNHVWNVMLHFLDPIMSFNGLQLPPIRELTELCQLYGWDVKFPFSVKNKIYMVEAVVDEKNIRSTTSATNRSKKIARKKAAQKLIANLKAQGYQLKNKSLEKILKTVRKNNARLVGYDEKALAPASCIDHSKACSDVDLKLGNLSLASHSCKHELSDINLANSSFEDCHDDRENLERTSKPDPTTNLSGFHPKFSASSSLIKKSEQGQPIDNKICNIDSDSHGNPHKKSAKSLLNEICVGNCWRSPYYEWSEEGPSHLRKYISNVVIVIEEAENIVIECVGQAHAKKKVAAEESAQGALWFLKKAGYLHN